MEKQLKEFVIEAIDTLVKAREIAADEKAVKEAFEALKKKYGISPICYGMDQVDREKFPDISTVSSKDVGYISEISFKLPTGGILSLRYGEDIITAPLAASFAEEPQTVPRDGTLDYLTAICWHWDVNGKCKSYKHEKDQEDRAGSLYEE
jgi:hypothetical protein